MCCPSADCDEPFVRGRQLRRHVHQVPHGPQPAQGVSRDAPVHRSSVQDPEGERTTGKTLAVRYGEIVLQKKKKKTLEEKRLPESIIC